MSRRALTLLVAGFLTLALAVGGAMLPVPYVVLSPGPTENTIGDVKGKPVITVAGHQTYPTTGMLSMVTVAYQGGPGNRIGLLTALRGWLDDTIAVVPEETIFPREQTVEEVEEENTAEMATSQETSTAAALRELKIAYQNVVEVASTDKGSPAEGKLLPGDLITTVDGAPATDMETVAALVRKHSPGEDVTFGVDRKGAKQDVTVKTVKGSSGQAIVGVRMGMSYKFPFTVNISVGDVGGPSAGLMFSLGIYDKLTPGPLTGGKAIAGTGTMDAQGTVGAIGGIEQKMVGAKKAGATIFLTPSANCPAAVAAVPDGLRLVKVDTLNGAIKAIDAIRTGSGSVPACTS
ncbi:PDZ domain-containing protein [Herbidospora sp. NEAU-GS84]|uniref:endopeptidase La n=1 Tax=Herbidospora solisilvae TaxID=2696284 RepID=A0A7C9JH22_9ACTN|nr:PDZ domain-containing protein [Herbidospora solisilvae]NAS27164.1 PDZ domain-containing protein [Herbidospora solisilvae]